MTIQWADAPAIFVGCLFGAVILAFYGYTFYTMLKRDRKQEEQMNKYVERKQNFVQGLDIRQKAVLDDMSSASQTEVMMRMEARIYELEQQLHNQQDDGK